MTMAFEHFANEKVDIAVIETGLGGRLDSTNIITPILSVITNISFDHTAFLGNTLPAIASEKAGIIKVGVPVIIGEAQGEVREVFAQKAKEQDAPILFAEDNRCFDTVESLDDSVLYRATRYGDIVSELVGDCQPKNASTVLTALPLLEAQGLAITPQTVKEGFAHVTTLTGLMGRWMTLQKSPHVVCDTGHNVGGWEYISRRLHSVEGMLYMVIGFVNDKDVSHILEMMPKTARYYFTNAQIERAMPVAQLSEIATQCGLKGEQYPSVEEAYKAALATATPTDTIFIGGSTFIVADLFTFIKERE